jgi:tetratricopeptide (TPR) repeat protein
MIRRPLQCLLLFAFASLAHAEPAPDEILRDARSLQQERKWKEAASLLAAQNLASWPEAKRLEALQVKAQSESFAKMGAEAEATIRQAIALRPKSPDLWVMLGDNYVLNQPTKSAETIAAYREVLKLAGESLAWQRFSAAVSLARVLTDEVQTDEALAVLKPFEKMANIPPTWQTKLLRARGHALAAAGRDADAMAQFRAALVLENETAKPAK